MRDDRTIFAVVRGVRMKISGYKFWLYQRVSSLFIVTSVGMLFSAKVCGYSSEQWREMIFESLASYPIALAYLMMLIHAMLGGYVVISDYVKNMYLRPALYAMLVCYILLGVWGLSVWVL